MKLHVMSLLALGLFTALLAFASEKTNPVGTSQELVIALSAVDTGTDVTVALRNNLANRDLTIQPVLRTGDGAETSGQPITLHARELREISLVALMDGASDASGQLILRFESPHPDNLLASVTFAQAGKPVHRTARAAASSNLSASGESRILWHRPTGAEVVDLVLTNTADSASTAVLEGIQSITLKPHTTMRVPVVAAGMPGTDGVVTVTSPAAVVITAVTSGAAAVFPYRAGRNKGQLAKSPDAAGVTLRSGPLSATSGVLAVLLQNASAMPVDARITLRQYFNGNSSPGGPVTVAIAPNATVFRELETASETAGWKSVDVEYSGGRGDLLGMAVLRKGTTTEAQVLSSSASLMFVGSRWQPAVGGQSSVRISNVGRKPTAYSVTFFGRDGSIVYKHDGPTVGPGEDRLLDLSQLRDQAIPDKKGRQVPFTSEELSFEVEAADASAPTLFVASAGPQPNLHQMCCGQVDPILAPDPWAGPVGFQGAEVPQTRNTCTGKYGQADAEWLDPGDTSIVSMDWKGMVTALAPGSTFLSADVVTWLGGLECGDVYYWPATAAANVQIPTDSRIVSDINSYALTTYTNPACPANQTGWYRKVKKIVTDQNGADIYQDGQSLSELATIGLPNDLQITTSTTGTAVTSGGGYFGDIYSVCSPQCPSNPGETDSIQEIFDTPPQYVTPFDLAYVSIKSKCTGITANGK